MKWTSEKPSKPGWYWYHGGNCSGRCSPEYELDDQAANPTRYLLARIRMQYLWEHPIMTRTVVTSLFMLVLFVSGCTSPTKYVPDITLTQTGPIIDAIAEFHSLYPAYALVSGKEIFGLDAPKTERVEPSELTRQVESELLKELDAAGVFSRVTRFDPNPDVLLSGRITALQEHYRPQVWAKIPGIPYIGMIAQLFRMKTHVSSGEAQLTLFVLKPTGEILGTYTGKSTFKESFNPTDDVPPGARLNRALSDAVHQIKDAISHDQRLRKLANGI